MLLQVLSDYASTTLQQLSLDDSLHSCKDGGFRHRFLSETNIHTLHCFPNVSYRLQKFELSVSFIDQIDFIAPSAQQHRANFKGGWRSSKAFRLRRKGRRAGAHRRPISREAMHQQRLSYIYTWARLRVLYLQRTSRQVLANWRTFGNATPIHSGA